MKCDASCANDAFAALRPTGQQISGIKKALLRPFFMTAIARNKVLT